jgi:BMFP domain-containing protein YqiC
MVTILVLFLWPTDQISAKDKSDRDRIVALEAENAKLRSDLKDLDAATQGAFDKTTTLLTKLARWNGDLEDRLSALESARHPKAKFQPGAR